MVTYVCLYCCAEFEDRAALADHLTTEPNDSWREHIDAPNDGTELGDF